MAKGQLFPVSWSKISDFQTCPYQYYSIRIAGTFPKLEFADNLWGTEVHHALEHNLLGEPLGERFKSFQPMMDKLATIPGEHFGERKMAMDVDMNPVPYESPSAFVWTIIDRLVIHGNTVVDIDYKTGKRKEVPSRQLDLSTVIVAQHYPEVENFHSMFIWTQGGPPSRKMATRADIPAIWDGFIADIEEMEWAYQHTAFPAKPSGLCRPGKGQSTYPGCPVLDCIHNQRPDARTYRTRR